MQLPLSSWCPATCSAARLRISTDAITRFCARINLDISNWDRSRKLRADVLKGGAALYRTILVPLDGSAFSERALTMAIELANSSASQLVLVRAAGAPVLAAAGQGEAQGAAVKEAESYLQGVALELSEAERASRDCGNAQPSRKRDSVRDRSTPCRLGDHVHPRPFRLWVDGSTDPWPRWCWPIALSLVLLVRRTGPQAVLTSSQQQSCLMVPLDGSASAETALPHALVLMRCLHCGIQLLSVVVPPELSTPAWGSRHTCWTPAKPPRRPTRRERKNIWQEPLTGCDAMACVWRAPCRKDRQPIRSFCRRRSQVLG